MSMTYKQEYYRKNKAKIDAKNKEWRKKNKAKMAGYAKKYWKKNKAKLLAKKLKWYNKYRERENLKHLLRNRGISMADYESLRERSGGMCEICRKRKATCVDHDHKTGEVRGMLCSAHNAGLGMMEDGALFDAAKQYLSRPPFKRTDR
jgi:hypothetical protein